MEPSMVRHDSMFEDLEIDKPLTPPSRRLSLFSLPAEIRTFIYELVFDVDETYAKAFHKDHGSGTPIELWHGYKPSAYLRPLLTSRQFYQDAHLLAFSRTLFVVTNPYICIEIKEHITSRLRLEQIESLRFVAFVADARHFRKLVHWKGHALGLPSLHLRELSIILHRSSYWHYLFDFNVALVDLLRGLQGVQRLTFVWNNALVKGTLHAWFNRFVALILKTDHHERFVRTPPCAERSWWSWEHHPDSQTMSLMIQPRRPVDMSIGDYHTSMAPLLEGLKLSVENEPLPLYIDRSVE